MTSFDRAPGAPITSSASWPIRCARSMNCAMRSAGRRVASVSLPVLAGVTLAMLIVWWIERIPIQVPPVDGGWR